jgi:hypothetical protein
MELLQKNAQMSIRRIENEIFLYDRKESLIHSFNETGTFLWEHYGPSCATPQLLAARLAETFEVDVETARNDADEFLKNCVEKNLLVSHA